MSSVHLTKEPDINHQVVIPSPAEIEAARTRDPVQHGRSKTVYELGPDLCLVEMVPSLDSFTYERSEMMPGTETLRLDFFTRAAAILEDQGIRSTFVRRVDPRSYLARTCPYPPFEVIVKNVAFGSTDTLYPGLFPSGHRFNEPVVKFDFRVDPQDLPIGEDYVREYGLDPRLMREMALRVNTALRAWLDPLDLWDFCLVIGKDREGEYAVTSEVSPDAMRLRTATGEPLDKDLFRRGENREVIIAAWQSLIERVS